MLNDASVIFFELEIGTYNWCLQIVALSVFFRRLIYAAQDYHSANSAQKVRDLTSTETLPRNFF